MLRLAWGTQGSRDIAQTRINARKAVALSPRLVDAAAVDGRAARSGSVIRHIQSSHRGHGVRIESRRAADVHLRSEKAGRIAGPRCGAARLHAVGRGL